MGEDHQDHGEATEGVDVFNPFFHEKNRQRSCGESRGATVNRRYAAG